MDISEKNQCLEFETKDGALSCDGHECSAIAAKGREGAEQEHKMGLLEGIRTYPWAVFWSVAVSMVIIMEGYDVVLVSALMAQPAFQRAYGTYYGPELGHQISGPWQAGLSNASVCGTIFGAYANGWVTQKFGYRNALVGSLAFLNGTIFLTFFAVDLPMLCAGCFLCGLPFGLFATLAPAYASEICPTVLRGYLANYVCFCWAAGLLLSAGIQEAFSSWTDDWAYRIPFAIQWAWPVPLICILWFTPESPWLLLRNGRKDEAEQVLRRLAIADEDSLKSTIAMMEHTIMVEDETGAGTSYWDCFKGTNLRRTEITCLTWVVQIADGTIMTGNPTYFFVQAGVGASAAFKLSVGTLGLAAAGVVVSWFLIYHFGRRTLYIFDIGCSLLALLAVGVASAISDSRASSFAQAGLVMLSTLIRFATVGPVCYAIIAEISAVSLRSKTLALARISYYLVQIVGNVISPYMINPTEGNWKGKAGFFWAGSCGLILVWAFFRLPETKVSSPHICSEFSNLTNFDFQDRTYEEIDLLFDANVPARKFKTARVDPYVAEHHQKVVLGARYHSAV